MCGIYLKRYATEWQLERIQGGMRLGQHAFHNRMLLRRHGGGLGPVLEDLN